MVGYYSLKCKHNNSYRLNYIKRQTKHRFKNTFILKYGAHINNKIRH